jgi:hypothetical protein
MDISSVKMPVPDYLGAIKIFPVVSRCHRYLANEILCLLVKLLIKDSDKKTLFGLISLSIC